VNIAPLSCRIEKSLRSVEPVVMEREPAPEILWQVV
jgi:hypothetical protein